MRTASGCSDLTKTSFVVLSNNDGCVIARSYDAKPFVKMGEPYFQIKHKLRQHGIVPSSPNEAFADLTGISVGVGIVYTKNWLAAAQQGCSTAFTASTERSTSLVVMALNIGSETIKRPIRSAIGNIPSLKPRARYKLNKWIEG